MQPEQATPPDITRYFLDYLHSNLILVGPQTIGEPRITVLGEIAYESFAAYLGQREYKSGLWLRLRGRASLGRFEDLLRPLTDESQNNASAYGRSNFWANLHAWRIF
jgi:hypothetical protein